jgi:RNA polymerase sigma factor (TIGR02999 family)
MSMDVPKSNPPLELGELVPAGELLPLVYQELRRLAAHKMAQEAPGQTLQPTALVHEAWLRIAGSHDRQWHGKTHFFAAAAEAMRRILVENARRKQRIKHGGGCQRVEVDAGDLVCPLPDDELLALDEALTQLAKVDSTAAELVNLRFFTGLTQADAAAQLGVSRSAADRTWVFARAWLFGRVRLPDEPGK